MEKIEVKQHADPETGEEGDEESIGIVKKITFELNKVYNEYYSPLRHHPGIVTFMTSTVFTFFMSRTFQICRGMQNKEKKAAYIERVKNILIKELDELKEMEFEDE